MRNASRDVRERDPLVGRAEELRLLDDLLDGLDEGASCACVIVGEPGIGKTRLLRELAARAGARDHLVLVGSGSELEHDLPFSVFVDALDEYLESLDAGVLASLDEDVQGELGQVFPALSGLGHAPGFPLHNERYRSHRAVRVLLERLANPAPLVLALDDLHWADSASIELFGTLLRRPPAGGVLLSLAFRPRQASDRFAAAVDRAERAGSLTRIELTALDLAEARVLLGDDFDAVDVSILHRESGGNPFYLQQLARGRIRHGTFAEDAPVDGLGVPPAVAASLNEELGMLSDDARLVLEGAAVAGDPFELDLAAAATAMSEASVVDAVDELLVLDILRPTDVPRRFRFRHPLIRRAAYDASADGWRLGAHERCAEALETRGVPAAGRAYHVERSARPGDAAAIAVLHEAGNTAFRLAPESAARWYGAALRLLPRTAPSTDRVDLLLARAWALAAAGRFNESHEAALEAAAIVPDEPALATTVATACAGIERFVGQYEHAHGRLVRALGVAFESGSQQSAELLTELTLNEFYRSRYDAMQAWAVRAVTAASKMDDRVLAAAAHVAQTLASALVGAESAPSHCARAATFVDQLTDRELSRRPDIAGWLAIAEVYLDMYAEADGHAARALELSRASGRGDPLHRLYPVLPRIWYVRGKLSAAAELLDGAIEGARLLGSPPALAGNLFNRCSVALAMGDLDVAASSGEEAFELARDLDQGFVSAWAAVRLASVRAEVGRPGDAVELLRTGAGGEELTLIPAGWRAYALELLTRCWLALDRRADAARAARLAEQTAAAVRLPLAAAWANRGTAAVALDAGDSVSAIDRAFASAHAAHQVGAPIEEGLSRTVAGRALAQAGDREQAVIELRRAAAALDACGARRYREAAERELGKLGRRPYRRTRRGRNDASGVQSLTERELEVALLVVDRKTNPEIAAELFLSKKTVERHLHNIFLKMDVCSRVALARAVEQANTAQPRGGE
ncbi:MAG TPA: AAA family ATPase [Gemmatimonadales bacterium]|nr:AAA family ATPase [Gemmatimonadales bacterium]